MANSIRKVTIVHATPAAAGSSILYETKKKRKKGTEGVRDVEKDVRHITDAFGTALTSYGSRHNRSNKKKKDGWLKDIDKNIMGAFKKGNKRLKLSKIF